LAAKFASDEIGFCHPHGRQYLKTVALAAPNYPARDHCAPEQDGQPSSDPVLQGGRLPT
jgi:hypothetical protein